MRALAPRTLQSYRSAVHSYLVFCHSFGVLLPFPLSELVLCRFVAFLGSKGLTYASIRVYLSALRFSQIYQGHPDPAFSSLCRLEYVLRGVRRSTRSHVRPPRLPITPAILQMLFNCWSHPPVVQDDMMLWAACCVGFFGFLRSGEFTCSTVTEDVLLVSDVSVDSHLRPSFVSLHLRHSKTDIFGVGAVQYLGLVDGPICPVKALLAYLALRGPSPGPLFIYKDGTPLSRRGLVTALRTALSGCGLDVSQFNGHSFRIGAATTAAANGIEDSLIQTLGRWKSSAFTAYIRTPRDTLLSVSSCLVSTCLSS